MIVLDAGAFIEVLLRSEAGAGVGELMRSSDVSVPAIFDAEVFSVLTLGEKQGRLAPAAVDAALGLLVDASVTRFPLPSLLGVARGYIQAVSGYDAFYVALAALLRCPLVTTDARLAATATSQFRLTVTHVPTSGRSRSG